MPRRNDRHEMPSPPPLPATVSTPKTWAQIKAEREARAERNRSKTIEERKQRERDSLDWMHCLVPACDGKVMNGASRTRNPDDLLPLCIWHEITVWQSVQRRQGDPTVIRTADEWHAAAVAAERQAEEQRQAQRTARQDGHIYFVRLNGLVKAGWSADVHERLRAYGPQVEVLCIYPGTRADETNLHRQLRPVLARGREWYEDCRIVADFVAAAVEQHGAPVVRETWTKPKQIIKPRKRSA